MSGRTSSMKRSSSPEVKLSFGDAASVAPSSIPAPSPPQLPHHILSLIASFVAHPSPLPFLDLDGNIQRRPNRFGLRPEVGFSLSGKPPPASYASASSSQQGRGGKAAAPGGVLGRLGSWSLASKRLRQVAMTELFRSVTVGEKRMAKVLVTLEEVVPWIRSLHVEHPSATKPGLESTLLYLPRLFSRTPLLTSLSFHLPGCRIPASPHSPSCHLQLLQTPPSSLPNLTSLAIHHQVCPACAAHILPSSSLGLGTRPHFKHLLLSGIIDHFEETVPALPIGLETLVFVQIEFAFFGAGGGAVVVRPEEMVERLARQCTGLKDLRIFPVAQDSFVVEEAHGGEGEFGEEFTNLLTLFPLLPNLQYLDIGLAPIAHPSHWPGFRPLPASPLLSPLPSFPLPSHVPSARHKQPSPSHLAAEKDHLFFAQLNWQKYLAQQDAWNKNVIAALRGAFPGLEWGTFETVVETFEGGSGGGGIDEWEDELWASEGGFGGRECAVRGRVAWEVVQREIVRAREVEEAVEVGVEVEVAEKEGEGKTDGEKKIEKVKVKVKETEQVKELIVYPTEAI